MQKNLLIRVYDVGFGDSIYVAIPDKDRMFHMLIDCGNSNQDSLEKLQKVLEDVRSLLRDANEGEERLDLLVVTHPHQDHIRGFNPTWFQGLSIGQIWLSAFMKEDHPQAKQARTLQSLSTMLAKALLYESHNLELSAADRSTLDLCITNARALDALRHTSGNADDTIDPDAARLYVCRDENVALKKAGLSFKDGTMCLRSFSDTSTVLRVLAPEWDIDGSYLGETCGEHTTLFARLLATETANDSPETVATGLQPANISMSDFQRLRSRLLYSSLAFCEMDEQLRNNTSVVLLLEWQGRRLLFCGDAEWSGTAKRKKSKKGSWNIMLENDKQNGHFAKPLDFLKVGHHGSINGSPYEAESGINETIFDRLLPASRRGRCQIVVSTESGIHGKKNPVPNPLLLRDLGRRAANARHYDGDIAEDQPQRTDLERYNQKSPVGYIEVELAPAR